MNAGRGHTHITHCVPALHHQDHTFLVDVAILQVKVYLVNRQNGIIFGDRNFRVLTGFLLAIEKVIGYAFACGFKRM